MKIPPENDKPADFEPSAYVEPGGYGDEYDRLSLDQRLKCILICHEHSRADRKKQRRAQWWPDESDIYNRSIELIKEAIERG